MPEKWDKRPGERIGEARIEPFPFYPPSVIFVGRVLRRLLLVQDSCGLQDFYP